MERAAKQAEVAKSSMWLDLKRVCEAPFLDKPGRFQG
jgi:hypothetical protein